VPQRKAESKTIKTIGAIALVIALAKAFAYDRAQHQETRIQP
jgi:hypothetical protein